MREADSIGFEHLNPVSSNGVPTQWGMMCGVDRNRTKTCHRTLSQLVAESGRTNASELPTMVLQTQAKLGVHIIDEEVLPVAIQVDERHNAQQCA